MIDRSIFTLKHIKKMLVILAALTVVRALFVVGQAWMLSQVVVNLWMGCNLYDQVAFLGLFLLCFVGRQAVLYLQDKLMERFSGRRAEQLREKLLHAVFKQGPYLVQKQGTGSVSTLLIEGIDQVETYVRLVLPKMVGLVFMPIVLLVVVAYFDWVSGLIMLVVFPAIIFYLILLGRTAKAAADAQYHQYRLLSNHFVDSFRGIDTLKLFGRTRHQGDLIFKVSEQFRVATMKTLRIATLSGTVLDLFSTLSLAGVAIMLGFRLVDGSISFLSALFVLVLVPEYFKPIREFASDYHASLEGSTALSAIRALVETEDLHKLAKTLRLPRWTSHSVLQLSKISFSYEGFQILKNLNFSTQGFMKVGIVGPSGSGKSSLINLLAGFASPTSGKIIVNDESLENLRQPSWSEQVLYLPQNPYLFHATLHENIVFYKPDASEEQVEQAVAAAGLEELIVQLPHGIHTTVGEGARSLSGGQAQRVALARALLDRSRRVLLFDEPTAHLDIETEQELKTRMLPLMNDRLVFFATHRLHWMHNMDVIIMLQKGRICECGTPKHLLEQNGAFAHFVNQVKGGVS